MQPRRGFLEFGEIAALSRLLLGIAAINSRTSRQASLAFFSADAASSNASLALSRGLKSYGLDRFLFAAAIASSTTAFRIRIGRRLPHDIHGIDVHRDGDEIDRPTSTYWVFCLYQAVVDPRRSRTTRLEQSLEPREISVCTRAKIDEDTANGRLLRKPFGRAADLADLGKASSPETLDLQARPASGSRPRQYRLP